MGGNQFIQTGQGWRLGWNPDAVEYKALVGGEEWSVELTAREFNLFCQSVQQLSETMKSLVTQLMEEELVSCELETEYLWMEVEGFPDAFRLSFILNQGRCVEGGWSASITSELIKGLARIQRFRVEN